MAEEPQQSSKAGSAMAEKPAAADDAPVAAAPKKLPVIADLNVDPPESDGEECTLLPDSSTRSSNEESNQVKSMPIVKDSDVMEIEDADQQCQGASISREEKVSSLKAGLVHVARKMPKNAHCHFILGLMYQRLGQPQKAVLAFEKSSEILLGCEEENRRPELFSLVQTHHAQCILQVSSDSSDKDLEVEELDDVLLKLKESMQSDVRHAAVWSTLGLLLLRTGRLQSAISVLSSLLAFAPDNLDTLANLGIAYLQSGNLELSAKCFQDLILKDQNHPAALVNYAAVLLSKYGSVIAGYFLNPRYQYSDNVHNDPEVRACTLDVIRRLARTVDDKIEAEREMEPYRLRLGTYGEREMQDAIMRLSPGAGASAGEGAFPDQIEAANVAKECLMAAAKADCKAAPIWLNLANAYFVAGNHKNARKCLEQAAKLEPNHMSTRYAVALHRIKDVERSLDPAEQLCWASNEMATILKDGDPAVIDPPIAWAGLAMVHRAQHEISAAFETSEKELAEAKERAQCTLKQAIEEDPDDAVQWHQLGLHSLCTSQFKISQKFLKAAVARCKECSYAWSNLGISLQLSEDPSSAEQVYKRALSLATTQQAHAILSNLGNLYRQLRRLQLAKIILGKSLDLCPGYAPAQNNLGLVFVVEGRWEEALGCFERALQADPLLDAAQSNMMKAMAMLKIGLSR